MSRSEIGYTRDAHPVEFSVVTFPRDTTAGEGRGRRRQAVLLGCSLCQGTIVATSPFGAAAPLAPDVEYHAQRDGWVKVKESWYCPDCKSAARRRRTA